MKKVLPALLLLTACTAGDRYRSRRVPAGEHITVLVPGYEGTFLYDHDGVVWVSPGQALKKDGRSLGSCASGLLPLEPGGPVTKFSVWPYVVGVYAGFLKWGEAELPGFTAFGYDWRQDLFVSAGELCEFIGEREASLVAHSMGGVVAQLAAGKCPGHIDAIVFAGVPFHGAPGALYDLLRGEQIMLNKSLVSAEALWTFPSKWQMLPRADDFFVDATGRKVSLPISEPATWSRWKLACPERLTEGLAQRARMPVELPEPSVPALAIIGRGRKSISAVRLGADGALDLKQPVLADGDGAVTVENATPPFQAEAVLTDAQHRLLLDAGDVRQAVKRFLEANRAGPLAARARP